MSPNSLIYWDFLVQKKKNAFKYFFQKISGYSKVKLITEDLFLIW